MAPHPLLAGLLFLILLLKTIPGGYMLVASDDGWPRLALCSGVAALPTGGSVPAAEHGAHATGHHQAPEAHHREPQPAKPAEIPCAFAALAAPTLPPPPLIAVALRPAAPLPLVATASDLRLPALAAPPPPATGPPHSA